MKRVDLVVFDLDNTLYDWYAAFVPAFYAMIDVAVPLLGCDREVLLNELRAVHVKHHNVEHPFSLIETKIVQAFIQERGLQEAKLLLDPAFHAFNKWRKNNLVLFPDVSGTLDELRNRGIRLFAFTDSSFFSTTYRVRRLNLAAKFERIYCRARTDSQASLLGVDADDQLERSIVELPADEAKPDPKVLDHISFLEGTPPHLMAYIGDSLAKDILMAKNASCFAIWAKYGVHRNRKMYEELIRISHWTEADIRRERKYAVEAAKITPDFTCEQSIAEVLGVLEGPLLGNP